MSKLASEPPSVPDLIQAAFESDSDAVWDAVAGLHWRGSKEVLDRALTLALSDDAFTRARAADVLGQLGIPERTFPDECFDAVLPLVRDDSQQVVFAAIIALQHIDRSRAAPHVIRFAGHHDDKIGYAAAFALGAVDTSEAVDTLLVLMRYRDAEVRTARRLALDNRAIWTLRKYDRPSRPSSRITILTCAMRLLSAWGDGGTAEHSVL